LEGQGLVLKTVDKAAGFYRTLRPVPDAIAALAAANPYPEKPDSYRQNPGRGATGKIRLAYPENPASPSRKNPHPLAGNSDTNTPVNIPGNFQQPSTTPPAPSAAASAGGGPQKKIEGATTSLPAQPAQPPAPPVAAAPPKPAKASAAIAAANHFAAFWQGWPKKAGKVDAERAFAKLSPDDQAKAAERAAAWFAARPDVVADLGNPARYRYVLHASTWLNQARWQDEAPAHPSTAFVSSHVQQSHSYEPRPVNGAKPDGPTARQLARAVSAHGRQQPG